MTENSEKKTQLTCHRDSARDNMTYVKLHLTFMSRSRFTGGSLLRRWVALKSSFCCAEE
jgi:hypothetical protein